LDEDPADRVAFEALTEIHEAEGAWAPLYDELARALAGGHVDDRTATLLRMADVARRAGRSDDAAAHAREVLASDAALADDALTAIEALADERGDAPLAFAALERRVGAAATPLEEAAWLEKMADLELGVLGRPDAGLARLALAAERAVAGLDAAVAERLYERVVDLAPSNRDAALALLGLYRDAGKIEAQARLYPLLLRATDDPAAAADALFAFEAVAAKAGALAAFVDEADALLAHDLAPDALRAVRAARARALAQRPETVALASAAYRQMIDAGDPEGTAAFEAFALARGPAGVDDRRWLFAFRVEHAVDDEQVRQLLAWAQFEESVARDAAGGGRSGDAEGSLRRASELHARVLAIDPDHDEALAARARLRGDLGDLEGAAAALAMRRDRSEGPARVALELELGALLLDRLGRPDEALDAIGEVLDAAPGDAAALELATRALARPDAAVRAARMLERAADAAEDAELAARLVGVLLSTPASMPELRPARRGWFERLLDREDQPPEAALEIALRAVRELPEDGSLWDRAEKLGRALARPDVVAEAYRRELARLGDVPPDARPSADAIEDVGRRAVEFLEEWFDDPEGAVGLLLRVVELVPTSAWAFERLKLVYNLGERWDELFALYDRVIAGAASD
ncbi:MAG TPA: hypothetical protein VHB21_05400, partial [Minicystis sp.]|nr:hypothetical protein [Minicystis sp.]